ncbi:MAG: SOS response-associated peptidase family protein [Candidatus Delongbacteria bacterium]|nr:SOS response-associated peptidase family protein [Candidatus Delongbacteria bacterium]
MCGRFAQVYDDTKLKEKFRLEDISGRVNPELNLTPGMKVNTVTFRGEQNILHPMIWGFSELHNKSMPALIFNSRIETIFSGSPLGQYLVKHRCIIPLSGFYERKGDRTFYIQNKDFPILSAAGVFVNDGLKFNCSVVTTDSTGSMRKIHSRMPLLLNDEFSKMWVSEREIEAYEMILECGRMAGNLEFIHENGLF